MKKLALVVVAMSLFSINSWGCSFDKSIAALKGLDPAVADGATYSTGSDSVQLANSGGQLTVSGLPACASGGGRSASIAVSVPDQKTGKMKQAVIHLVKSGKIIMAYYKDVVTGEAKSGKLVRK